MPTSSSSILRGQSLLCASIFTLTLLGAGAAPVPTIQYFRSDAGVADPKAGPLPDNFEAPESLVWRVTLDSGHSTPIIHGGRIFLTTYRSANQELATVALDQKTGQILWKRAITPGKVEEVHPQNGNPATPTPACDGERIYVFFGSQGLLCYDLDGKPLWESRMGPFRDEYGAGSSPIVVDGKVIVNQDHDIDSFLLAVDRLTGKTLWKTERPQAVRSYATPVVWTHDGVKQLLVAGALELAAYDVAKGEKLWWLDGLARIVIPVPVISGDTIYMASWAPGGDSGAKHIQLEPWASAITKWDTDKDGLLSKAEIKDPEVLNRFFRMDLNQDGKLNQMEWEHHAAFFQNAQNALLALKPTGRGDLSGKGLLWKYLKGVPYVATPVLHDGRLWMAKDGGIVTELDAESGKVLQEERLPGAAGDYYASPIAADGKIYFASQQGVVTVLADSAEWKILSSHKFGEKIFATPVAVGNQIYLRTEKALYCFRGIPAK